jgi:FkbM family methyltransferase
MTAPFLHISDIAKLDGGEFEKICKANTSYAYLGNNVALCRILSRYKIFVDTRDIGLTPHLIMDGFWETWLTQCLATIIKPGDVCIDVGANFGYYSILMSELSGPDGKTIAVEPNPSVCRMLRHTEAIHSSHFEIVEAALCDKTGKAILMIPEDFPGDSSMIARHDKKGRRQYELKVRALTLDDLVGLCGIEKVDVIKIDAEGVEPAVLAGMKKTIENNPGIRIVLEYSPFLYSDAAGFTRELFSYFTVYRIKDVPVMEQLDELSIDKLVRLTDHTDLYLTCKSATAAAL